MVYFTDLSKAVVPVITRDIEEPFYHIRTRVCSASKLAVSIAEIESCNCFLNQLRTISMTEMNRKVVIHPTILCSVTVTQKDLQHRLVNIINIFIFLIKTSNASFYILLIN